ncbi:MAG TPA: hypothetical protein K8V21_00405 [Weissella thailandensis]|uniref:hypothetical protein n=1 Tax=Weissella thailandensis TaxID=89061 RepID=UPI001D78B5F4|nr:hypothetical protein [Weissella thailandensis]HJG83868.1 hypothetical protein [Weissella thailandensis]
MANKFTNFKFTREGKSTLTNVLATKGAIAITQVYTFATKLNDSLVFTQLSELNPKQIKPVGTVSAHQNTVETRLQIDNSELTTDYNLQGLALVGTYNGENFVLGYINTNESTNVPAFSGDQVQTIALDVSFAISDTSVITINTQTAGMLTVADYNALVAFIKEQVAPLSVDKKVVHLTDTEIIDGIKTFKKKISGSINGNANTVDYINIHQVSKDIDLNTITKNGNYLSTLVAKKTSNKPSGSSEQYSLVSLGNMQLFSDIKTDKVYIRNQIKTDTFTPWKIILEDVNQTLRSQFNFSKTPTVNDKPVALQADIATETANRSKADKDINKSLATEATTRSTSDSGLTKNINTVSNDLANEKVARSSADSTLTKSISDTQKDLKTETTNRTNADNRIDSSAVHKTGNESISGEKSFNNKMTVNGVSQAEWFYKHNKKGTKSVALFEVIDDNFGDGKPRPVAKYYSGETFGSGISISGMGLTAIGSGESSDSILDLIQKGNGYDTTAFPFTTMDSENLILSSDNAIYFLQGQNTAPNYTNIWRLSNGGYWDRYDEKSKKWTNVIPNTSGLLAQDASVVHKSGNETITGTKSFSSTISGSVSGNAGSATKLKTARKINGTAFDGTRDINVNAANDSNIVHRNGNENIAGNKNFTGTVTAGKTRLTDSGWKNLSSSSGSVKYRILNGVVYLSVLSAKGKIGSTIATLPAGARPGQDIWTPYYSAKVSGNYKVQPNGQIYRASESSSFNNGESSMWVNFPADK